MTDNLPEHSDVMGGSTAAQRIYCPGSYMLEKEVSKEVESSYAKEGTALHHCMEHVLNELEIDADLHDELVGKTFYGIEITAEHVDNKIIPALDAFDEICEKYGGLVGLMVEVKGTLEPMVPGAFGTVDVLAKMYDGTLLVLDWKFGDGVPVSVIANLQLAFYAGCALYNKDDAVRKLIYGDDPDTGKTPTMADFSIVFAIVQPRRGVAAPHYAVWETNSQWIGLFIRIAKDAYDQAMKPNAQLQTGSHCRWCRAVTCPLKNKQIGEALTKKPESMDVISLAGALKTADELESWIKKVRARGHAELDNGVPIPGRKLVAKRSSRVYNDKKKAEGVLVRQLKTAKAYEPRVLISPAQAQKKLGKDKYERLVSKHVSFVSSGTTMVAASDKRQAVDKSLDTLDETAKNVVAQESALFKKKVES